MKFILPTLSRVLLVLIWPSQRYEFGRPDLYGEMTYATRPIGRPRIIYCIKRY